MFFSQVASAANAELLPTEIVTKVGGSSSLEEAAFKYRVVGAGAKGVEFTRGVQITILTEKSSSTQLER